VKFKLPGVDAVRLNFSLSTVMFPIIPWVQFIALPSFEYLP